MGQALSKMLQIPRITIPDKSLENDSLNTGKVGGGEGGEGVKYAYEPSGSSGWSLSRSLSRFP